MIIVSAVEIPTDQKMAWIITYDSDNLVTEEMGQRYYNLFLRSTVRDPGTDSKDKVSVANAFEVKYLMEDIAKKEKALNSNLFRLRFNYPSAISANGQITWNRRETKDIPVDYILPE
jgi:hypothetical protein